MEYSDPSTWTTRLVFYKPDGTTPCGGPNGSIGGIFAGAGSTGIWDGSDDPGGTILVYSGVWTANGYKEIDSRQKCIDAHLYAHGQTQKYNYQTSCTHWGSRFDNDGTGLYTITAISKTHPITSQMMSRVVGF
jgi:hypothetical protein